MRRHGWQTQAEVVRATHIDRTLISNWLNPQRYKQPSVANCRRAAEAFGVPLLNVLVVAGHITAEEAGIPPLPERAPGLSEMSASEVAEELQRKIARLESALEQALIDLQRRLGEQGVGPRRVAVEGDVEHYRAPLPQALAALLHPEESRRTRGGC
jgi:transcriptional regulator with XRE-family HTH domain